jgi:hypothetical protein
VAARHRQPVMTKIEQAGENKFYHAIGTAGEILQSGTAGMQFMQRLQALRRE